MTTFNAMYDKGREKFAGPASGQVNWTNDTIKAVLVDADQYGLAVSGATNATPIVITTTTHSLTSGDNVMIVSVAGNTAANGVYNVTVLSSTTFSLQDYNNGGSGGANIAGNGAYTSGGRVMKLSSDEFLSDIPSGARISTSAALTSKTMTRGVFDAADTTFTAPAAGTACELVATFKDTGSAATSPLLHLISSATGLPVTTNGADISLAWSNTANVLIGKL